MMFEMFRSGRTTTSNSGMEEPIMVPNNTAEVNVVSDVDDDHSFFSINSIDSSELQNRFYVNDVDDDITSFTLIENDSRETYLATPITTTASDRIINSSTSITPSAEVVTVESNNNNVSSSSSLVPAQVFDHHDANISHVATTTAAAPSTSVHPETTTTTRSDVINQTITSSVQFSSPSIINVSPNNINNNHLCTIGTGLMRSTNSQHQDLQQQQEEVVTSVVPETYVRHHGPTSSPTVVQRTERHVSSRTTAATNDNASSTVSLSSNNHLMRQLDDIQIGGPEVSGHGLSSFSNVADITTTHDAMSQSPNYNRANHRYINTINQVNSTGSERVTISNSNNNSRNNISSTNQRNETILEITGGIYKSYRTGTLVRWTPKMVCIRLHNHPQNKEVCIMQTSVRQLPQSSNNLAVTLSSTESNRSQPIRSGNQTSSCAVSNAISLSQNFPSNTTMDTLNTTNSHIVSPGNSANRASFVPQNSTERTSNNAVLDVFESRHSISRSQTIPTSDADQVLHDASNPAISQDVNSMDVSNRRNETILEIIGGKYKSYRTATLVSWTPQMVNVKLHNHPQNKQVRIYQTSVRQLPQSSRSTSATIPSTESSTNQQSISGNQTISNPILSSQSVTSNTTTDSLNATNTHIVSPGYSASGGSFSPQSIMTCERPFQAQTYNRLQQQMQDQQQQQEEERQNNTSRNINNSAITPTIQSNRNEPILSENQTSPQEILNPISSSQSVTSNVTSNTTTESLNTTNTRTVSPDYLTGGGSLSPQSLITSLRSLQAQTYDRQQQQIQEQQQQQEEAGQNNISRDINSSTITSENHSSSQTISNPNLSSQSVTSNTTMDSLNTTNTQIISPGYSTGGSSLLPQSVMTNERSLHTQTSHRQQQQVQQQQRQQEQERQNNLSRNVNNNDPYGSSYPAAVARRDGQEHSDYLLQLTLLNSLPNHRIGGGFAPGRSYNNMSSYGQLLGRFGNSGRHLLGASHSDIQRLPEFTITDPTKQLPQEDHKRCFICLEDFEINDIRKIVPCLHGFHKQCLDRWLIINGSCPICKHNICS